MSSNRRTTLTSAARALGLAVLLAAGAPALAAQSTSVVQELDGIFEAFDSARSPGCAVAAARNGEALVSRAYGMADLEHRVANSTETIFEAGSVSKQFTAAAIILLALDGEISLDDDVRTYVPELPDYGETITIRQMMTHTSGLRDWGSVAGISGWGRSNRTHDHDHVVDILSRQSALNFPPGDQYSYSNSGYNLMAVIVDRVSGVSFAEFSRERIFEPLGMHDTQWRDDYRRVVPDRSSAYSPAGGGYRINRPIEHVHGNGGLLTTVGDMLTWNEHLRQATLGQRFVDEMYTRGVLNDGRQIGYAGGLQFGSQSGHARISHTGATSGYRAYLGYFPDQGLSVALLCNVTSANPGGLGGQVASLFLPETARGEDEIDEAADREMTSAEGVDVEVAGGVAEQDARAAGRASAAAAPEGTAAEAQPPTGGTFSIADPSDYVGTYHSEDAETTLRVTLEGDTLFLHRRPASSWRLQPTDDEADTFRGAPVGTIRFIRDDEGRVTEFSVSQGRVFDLRFYRIEE